MESYTGQLTRLPDAMNKLMMSLAVVSIALLTPFAINNFVQGRILLGLGAALIVLILAFNAWSITKYKRYYPNLILYGLVPAILFFLNLSLRTQGIIGVLWCYPAVFSFYFMLPERKAWIANAALLLTTIPFVWFSFDYPLAARIVVTLIIVSIFSAIFINIIADQQKSLQIQAVTDPLTGVLNRTLLNETLQQAIQQHARSQIPMTLVSFDLDHFKKINDEKGHDAGDAVLQDVAKLLKKRCRRVDKVFRLGGEEFLVFLYNTEIDDGKHVAEEIRTRVASLQTLPGYTITVSIGIATLQSGEDWRGWMKRSDTNLYHAKESGRNRVVAA